jgi:uncharacterized membrane protein
MIKAFFKGVGIVLLVFLIIAIGITGLIGLLHLATYISPILSIISLIGVTAIGFGITLAYEEYQQMQDPEYDYQKEKKLIQEMWKTNWLTDEEYKVMISKLITKYHNKGVK